ncbi:MAG: tetraacyldisaccharide 4'-kinase, partial [Myxococcales bacterium]|nr:tetraacyldisaccharide 4'-kinase [Myxococcales bacterium]
LVEARRFVSSAYRAVGVRGLDEPLRLLPIESLRGRRLVAFSGIATPESFFDQLDDLGYDVRERVRFPDHHWFDAVDLRQLRDAVARQGATALVTTEKDLVRLPPDRDSSIYALVVEVAPHHDRDAIVGWVMGES